LLASQTYGSSSLLLRISIAGRVVRFWKFDLRPVQVEFTLDWREAAAEEDYALRVRVTWLGLPSQELSLHLFAGDLELAARPIPSTGTGRLPVPRSCEVQFDLLMGELDPLRESDVSCVELCLIGEPVSRQVLPPMPPVWRRESEPENIAAEIRRIWRTSGRSVEQEDRLAEQTLYLTELYLRQRGEMPFASVAGMTHKLANRGTCECREAVTGGYRLLEALRASSSSVSEEQFQGHVPPGKLGMFLLTLWTINQTRLRQTGEAQSARFNELADAFEAESGQSEDSLWTWAQALASYCREQAAELCDLPRHATPDLSAAELEQLASAPLVGFDPTLNSWLKTLTRERVSY
jgi:hypothetical protein